ncbi:ATP-dependent Clp protease adapter ClpS [Actinomycetospora sp. OC33-EN07]|uniref:ATP-dependent Clp protease adapter protein ClpS n=1 Tax=Actinomycetospora flava TaxID=3129232 RepID=A0ABU8MFF9_9PSEU
MRSAFGAAAPLRFLPPEVRLSAPAEPEVDERTEESVDEATLADTPWQTIVWNDPVNLMSYVTYVFQKLFGYDKAKATALMMDVHQKGRATVSSGSREKVEGDVSRLHAAGLWATMQRAS